MLKHFVLAVSVILLLGCNSVPEKISSEYFNIGNAYFEVQDYEKAIEYYTKALVDGHSMENRIRFNLAVALAESGRYELAIEHFDFLLQLDPENLMVLESKAYCYYLSDKLDKALELYDQILSGFEYSASALYNKAQIIIEEQPQEALLLLEKLYEIDNSVDVVLLLGRLYSAEEDRQAYVELYEQAHIDNPQNPLILESLIQYYLEETLFYKSIEFIDKLLLISDYEKKPDMLFKKAQLEFIELDDYATGFETLVEALDAGYKDENQINQLLANEKLSDDSQLIEYMKLRGFL